LQDDECAHICQGSITLIPRNKLQTSLRAEEKFTNINLMNNQAVIYTTEWGFYWHQRITMHYNLYEDNTEISSLQKSQHSVVTF